MMGVFGVALIGMNRATHRPVLVLVLDELGASMRQLAACRPSGGSRYFQSASIVSQANLRDRGKRRKRPSSMALSRRVVHRAIPEPRRLSGAAIGETRWISVCSTERKCLR